MPDLAQRRILFINTFFEQATKFEIQPITQELNTDSFDKLDSKIFQLANEVISLFNKSKTEKIRNCWFESLNIIDFCKVALLYIGSDWSVNTPHRYKNEVFPVIASNFVENMHFIRYIRCLTDDLYPDENHKKSGIDLSHVHIQAKNTRLNIHIPILEKSIKIYNKNILI